jgi:hypothetical protein
MQVRDAIAEYRRVHVVGPCDVAQSAARSRTPPAHGTGFGVSEISQARRVP